MFYYVLYILFHYHYFTIIRIFFPIIFPIISQRTIISLYYFTIIELLYGLFLLLFLIISGFRIPIFRSWRTPIRILCAEGWLISVQECLQNSVMTTGRQLEACIMKPGFRVIIQPLSRFSPTKHQDGHFREESLEKVTVLTSKRHSRA